MKTHCDCGKKLSPCFSSWFCPVCDGDNPPSRAKPIEPDFKAAIEKMAKEPNYFRRGHYTMRIDAVRAGRTRKNQDFVSIDATVLDTHNDGDGVHANWHRPGEQVTQLLMADSPRFLPAMKLFVGAVCGILPAQVTADMCDEACRSDHCIGAVIDANNRLMVTRSGHSFISIRWTEGKD